MIQKKTVGNTYKIILVILLQITDTNQSEIEWVYKLNMKVLLIVANHDLKIEHLLMVVVWIPGE